MRFSILKSVLTRRGLDNLAVVVARIVPTDHIEVPKQEMVTPIQDLIAEAMTHRPDDVVKIAAGSSAEMHILEGESLFNGLNLSELGFQVTDRQVSERVTHLFLDRDDRLAQSFRSVFNFSFVGAAATANTEH